MLIDVYPPMLSCDTGMGVGDSIRTKVYIWFPPNIEPVEGAGGVYSSEVEAKPDIYANRDNSATCSSGNISFSHRDIHRTPL